MAGNEYVVSIIKPIYYILRRTNGFRFIKSKIIKTIIEQIRCARHLTYIIYKQFTPSRFYYFKIIYKNT